MADLLALFGKGKAGPPSAGGDTPAEEDSPERSYAREAFAAVKDDDEEGFISAITAMVKACSKKSEPDGDEYEATDDEV